MLLDFHESFAWFVIIANGLAGLWALGAHWFEPLRTRALWWFITIAELTIFVKPQGKGSRVTVMSEGLDWSEKGQSSAPRGA